MNIRCDFKAQIFSLLRPASLFLVLSNALFLAAATVTDQSAPTVMDALPADRDPAVPDHADTPPLAQLVRTSAPLTARARAKAAATLVGALHTGDLATFESSFRALGGPVHERFGGQTLLTTILTATAQRRAALVTPVPELQAAFVAGEGAHLGTLSGPVAAALPALTDLPAYELLELYAVRRALTAGADASATDEVHVDRKQQVLPPPVLALKQNQISAPLLLAHASFAAHLNKSYGKTTPLILATNLSSQERAIATVHLLTTAPALVDLNLCDHAGNAALVHAVRRQQPALVDLLLAAGAQPDVSQRRPIFYALQPAPSPSKTAIVRSLIQANVSLASHPEFDHNTPLMAACIARDPDSVAEITRSPAISTVIELKKDLSTAHVLCDQNHALPAGKAVLYNEDVSTWRRLTPLEYVLQDITINHAVRLALAQHLIKAGARVSASDFIANAEGHYLFPRHDWERPYYNELVQLLNHTREEEKVRALQAEQAAKAQAQAEKRARKLAEEAEKARLKAVAQARKLAAKTGKATGKSERQALLAPAGDGTTEFHGVADILAMARAESGGSAALAPPAAVTKVPVSVSSRGVSTETALVTTMAAPVAPAAGGGCVVEASGTAVSLPQARHRRLALWRRGPKDATKGAAVNDSRF